MIKKMLRHTLLSACVIGLFTGGYAVTFGSGLHPPHSAYGYDRWDD